MAYLSLPARMLSLLCPLAVAPPEAWEGAEEAQLLPFYLPGGFQGVAAVLEGHQEAGLPCLCPN